MENLHNIEQRSPEWHKCRLGKITASKINDVMSKIKSGEAAARRDYRVQLAVERLTGEPTESFTNAAMQWGVDQEDSAREVYEFISGNTVEQIGFVDHPSIPMSGCSPDGLIGDDGMVEIKCPKTATHVGYLLDGGIPKQHMNQMQWQMECADRQWCHFVSYDPRMPTELQLYMVHVERDEELLANIRQAVIALLGEVETMVQELRARIV